jgi:hypothetical protein
MEKIDKSVKCWECQHLDKSDVNDYETVNFCGFDTGTDYGKEIEEDMSNGELHPVGKCLNFLHRTTAVDATC